MEALEAVVSKWFTKEWYKYLLESKNPDVSWFTVVRCRMGGHKCGVVWYNFDGLEPDMHCKECGDDLG
jgi:hypothetical protein